nr:RNA-binding protein [Streptomyces sp. DSM 41633]
MDLDGEPDQGTGSIRIPELSRRRTDHPTDAVTAGQRGVSEGDEITVRIVEVDLVRRRLSSRAYASASGSTSP